MQARNITPDFSLQKVDHAADNIRVALKAGKEVQKNDEIIIENRRASHAHVLNTWQATLRGRIKKSKSKIVFAQRQKRLPTIYDKFIRWPKIKFSSLQDIAGCRLIFESLNDLYKYRKDLINSKTMKHKKIRTNDYIEVPKESGYRGIHDIYEYFSKQGLDRSNKWDGLKLEIQYRTITQHLWATAVEIADCLTNGRIKYSDGNENLLYFFKLSSEILSRVYENLNSCLPELNDKDLILEFNRIEEETKLFAKLKAAKKANIKNTFKNGNNIILDQYFDENGNAQINVEEFKSLTAAQNRYFELEHNGQKHDIVLVRANDSDSRNSIKNAYRNYFVDTEDFVKHIEEALSKLSNN